MDPAIAAIARTVALARIDPDGSAWIMVEGRIERARVLAGVTGVMLRQALAATADVLVVDDRGDHRTPIIIGVVADRAVETASGAVPARLELEALDGLVLRCGEATITLTKQGKIVIDGAYVASKSTGVNAIKGAAVRIN